MSKSSILLYYNLSMNFKIGTINKNCDKYYSKYKSYYWNLYKTNHKFHKNIIESSDSGDNCWRQASKILPVWLNMENVTRPKPDTFWKEIRARSDPLKLNPSPIHPPTLNPNSSAGRIGSGCRTLISKTMYYIIFKLMGSVRLKTVLVIYECLRSLE